MGSRTKTPVLNRLSRIAAVSISFTVILLTYASVMNSYRYEHARTTKELMKISDRISSETKDAMDAVVADARILRNMPPIDALARAARNGGVDPVSGDTDAEWRDRLATIFASFHEMRPNYLQIRFVGLKNNGLELVRVDRTETGPYRTIDQDLQQKGREPYFEIANSLDRGDVYIGAPSWNRENGVISEPRTLVTRVYSPVFDENDIRIGFLIINLDFMAHNQSVYRSLETQSDFFISNSSGGRYTWDADLGVGHMEMTAGNAELPRLSSDATPTLEKANGVFQFTTRLAPFDGLDRSVFLTVEAPSAALGARMRSVAVLLIGLGVLIVFSGWFFARTKIAKVLEPLSAMNREIIDSTASDRKPALPVTLRNEIGELAGNFYELIGKLQKQEANARRVFDSVNDEIVIIDDSGEIQRRNKASFLASNESPNDHELKKLVHCVASNEAARLESHIAAVRSLSEEEKTPSNVLYKGAPRDMREADVWLEITISKLNQAEGEFVVVMRDVSERVTLEQEMKELVSHLKSSNSDLEEFAYIASHDLKAPLRAISYAASWLEEDLEDNLTDETREHLYFMRSRIDRMGRLLDDLLHHAKIGSQKFDPSKGIVEGATLTSDLLQLLAPPDNFKITFSEAFIGADFNHQPLQTVLLNLIGNAIKHGDKPEGQISVSLRSLDTVYEISIEDNGPGIPEKYHDHIFGLFKTLESRDKIEGSGMGLAFVRKHLVNLGQTINVVSEGNGNGTIFILTWPKPTPEGKRRAA